MLFVSQCCAGFYRRMEKVWGNDTESQCLRGLFAFTVNRRLKPFAGHILNACVGAEAEFCSELWWVLITASIAACSCGDLSDRVDVCQLSSDLIMETADLMNVFHLVSSTCQLCKSDGLNPLF